MGPERPPDHATTLVAVAPEILRYYDETWLDYRWLWLHPHADAAIHFDYWDERTHSHSDSLANMNRLLACSLDVQPGRAAWTRAVASGGARCGSPGGMTSRWSASRPWPAR